jgi:hypothetical protein
MRRLIAVAAIRLGREPSHPCRDFIVGEIAPVARATDRETLQLGRQLFACAAPVRELAADQNLVRSAGIAMQITEGQYAVFQAVKGVFLQITAVTVAVIDIVAVAQKRRSSDDGFLAAETLILPVLVEV